MSGPSPRTAQRYPRRAPTGDPMRPNPDVVRQAAQALAVTPSRDVILENWGLRHIDVKMAAIGLDRQALTIPFHGTDGKLLGVKLRHLSTDTANRFSWLNSGRAPAIYLPAHQVHIGEDIVLAEGPLKALALQVILGRPVLALASGVQTGIPEEGRPLFAGKRVWFIADPDEEGQRCPSLLTRQLTNVALELRATTFPDPSWRSNGAKNPDVNDVLRKLRSRYGDGVAYVLPGVAAYIVRRLDTAPDLLHTAPANPEKIQREAPNPWRFVRLDASEYVQWPITKRFWALAPILCQSSLGYIGGLPRTMKSFISLSIILHIIHGKPWLDRYAIGEWRPRFLYVAREDPPDRIQDRIRELQAGYNFPPIPPDTLTIYSRERFNLMEPSHQEWLVKTCAAEERDAVFLDVVGRMIPGMDQFQPRDWGLIQDALEHLVRDHGLTLILLDHARKIAGDKTGSPSPLDIKGLVEKVGWADWSMVLARDQNVVEVVTESKETDDIIHVKLEISPQAKWIDSAWHHRNEDRLWVPGDPPGPKFAFLGDVTKMAQTRAKMGVDNREAVYKTFKPGARLTAEDVVGHLARTPHPLKRSTVCGHLKGLVEAGRLDRSPEKEPHYWMVTDLIVQDNVQDTVQDKSSWT